MKKVFKRTLAFLSVGVLATAVASITACGNNSSDMPSMPTSVNLGNVAIEEATDKANEMLKNFDTSKNCSLNYIDHEKNTHKAYNKDNSLYSSSDREFRREVAFKYLETDKPYAQCVIDGNNKEDGFTAAQPDRGREEINISITGNYNAKTYLNGDTLSVVRSSEREENGKKEATPLELIRYIKQDWEDDAYDNAKQAVNYAISEFKLLLPK